MADKENVAESAATGQRQPRRAAVPPQVRDDSVPVSLRRRARSFVAPVSGVLTHGASITRVAQPTKTPLPIDKTRMFRRPVRWASVGTRDCVWVAGAHRRNSRA
jgi:hypothetical protein